MADQMTRCEVPFPETSTVDVVESRLMAEHQENGCLHADSLHLDFSRTEFVDLPALLHVISLLVQRRRTRRETTMALPIGKRPRDFLQIWNFGQAVKDATDGSLDEVFSPEDVACLSEDINNAVIRYSVNWKYDGSLQRLLSSRFFSLLSFFANRSPGRNRVASDESERWQHELIRAVLDRHLGRPDNYVGSRIVYEACTNALRHPGATVVQTASSFLIFGKSASARSTGYLTIVFWDDGVSMIDTLRGAIDAGKSVQALRVPALYADYRFSVHEYSGSMLHESPMRSDYVPTRDTPDDLLLLSTTFPGITRDALGEDWQPNPSLQTSNPELNAPGMGLFVLVNTAVDIFSGRVTIRTKGLRLTISRDVEHQETRYAAKVTKYNPNSPSFLGNLVTIRLPIRLDRA